MMTMIMILAFASRRIGRWLTPVRPLLPLFTSNMCRFTMQTVPACTMPWVATLNIRFSDKVKGNRNDTGDIACELVLRSRKEENVNGRKSGGDKKIERRGEVGGKRGSGRE